MMTIGKKIQYYRDQLGLTQEVVAEAVGISRQTLSSWENGRSYPDSHSLVLLGELFDVSLDDLLCEDKELAQDSRHNHVRITRRKLMYQTAQIGIYVLLWGACVAWGWLGGFRLYAAYFLYTIYAAIPVLTITFGALIGADEQWKWGKWIFLLLGGSLFVMFKGLTTSLANVVHNDKTFMQWWEQTWDLHMFTAGVLLALIGLVLGIVLKYGKRAAVKKQVR